ncbi:hypothetical protein KP15_104 [Klebsiella phage KP15]|uniref:Uncharacterized protein n=1 Tax=Klebsiella phage KP15 TaxID=707757 RepID=D5JFF2_9CAUD|nr:hypothetical protein KP15_104 [Klebsiella phage KP15]ADE34936.1 hypothetical protein KP15_104 [Klebsiella phage KP15]
MSEHTTNRLCECIQFRVFSFHCFDLLQNIIWFIFRTEPAVRERTIPHEHVIVFTVANFNHHITRIRTQRIIFQKIEFRASTSTSVKQVIKSHGMFLLSVSFQQGHYTILL